MVHCNFVKGNHPCSAELTSQLECLAKVMHYSICFKVLKCQHLQTTSLTASIGEGGGGESFAMVTALASHQCGLGSHPGVDTICGLSLLLFRSPASRGFFSSEYFGFPLSPQTTLWNSNRSGTHRHKRGLKNSSVFRGEKKIRFKGSCALIVLDIWFLFNF